MTSTTPPSPVSGAPAAVPVTYLVMAKAPVPGTVKTRLTPAFSPYEAAALAAAALLDTLDVVRAAAGTGAGDCGRAPVVALSGDLDEAAAPDTLRRALADFTVVDQQGVGLGSRLGHAHRDAAGEFGATVQVGMDTPQLSASTLAVAGAMVVAADGPDAVLGPADDGGWWLLALRRAGDARLIGSVPMSTPDTGSLTRTALEQGGLRVAFVSTLRDVDEPGDVPLVAAAAPGTRFAALADTLGDRTSR